MLKMGGSGDEFRAVIALANARGWIVLHGSGTFIQMTQAGSDLFAA